MSLKISKLKVKVEQKEVIKGLSLEVKPGEVHVIMGPNGSGKSTLANTIMGNPKYTIVAGQIFLDKKNISKLTVDKRAKLGLFLSMQYPAEIEGLTIGNFLRAAVSSLQGKKINPIEFHKLLSKRMKELGIDPLMAKRSINVGFSGGEKKRLEILQLLMLDPKYAILDETDSGLDVDALKVVARGINNFRGKGKGVLLITHYNRILKYVIPDYVHIMRTGKIVKSGGKELAKKIEQKGYEGF